MLTLSFGLVRCHNVSSLSRENNVQSVCYMEGARGGVLLKRKTEQNGMENGKRNESFLGKQNI